MAIIRWFSVSANDQGSRICASPGGGAEFDDRLPQAGEERRAAAASGYCSTSRSRGSWARAHSLVCHLRAAVEDARRRSRPPPRGASAPPAPPAEASAAAASAPEASGCRPIQSKCPCIRRICASPPLEIARLALGELLPGLGRRSGRPRGRQAARRNANAAPGRASAAWSIGILAGLLLLRHRRPLLAGRPSCRIGAGGYHGSCKGGSHERSMNVDWGALLKVVTVVAVVALILAGLVLALAFRILRRVQPPRAAERRLLHHRARGPPLAGGGPRPPRPGARRLLGADHLDDPQPLRPPGPAQRRHHRGADPDLRAHPHPDPGLARRPRSSTSGSRTIRTSSRRGRSGRTATCPAARVRIRPLADFLLYRSASLAVAPTARQVNNFRERSTEWTSRSAPK